MFDEFFQNAISKDRKENIVGQIEVRENMEILNLKVKVIGLLDNGNLEKLIQI